MKFRVIDKRTGDDITKDYFWVITADGRFGYVDYEDFISLAYAEAIMIPEGEDGKWITYSVGATNEE